MNYEILTNPPRFKANEDIGVSYYYTNDHYYDAGKVLRGRTGVDTTFVMANIVILAARP